MHPIGGQMSPKKFGGPKHQILGTQQDIINLKMALPSNGGPLRWALPLILINHDVLQK